MESEINLREFIHSLFFVSENHELPSAIMQAIEDPGRWEEALEKFHNQLPDLRHDYLRDYFQENQADRSNLMQDYTPDGICQILAGMAKEPKRIADVCAGTGALTVGLWQKCPDAQYVCYELSTASIPFLLFNLSLRKIEGYVVHGDVLTEEIKAIYKLNNGQIERVKNAPEQEFDLVISNPPYSLKWSGVNDFRFRSYPFPPKSKADYAFILICLSMVKDDGQVLMILPHGVLFRGAGEADCRKALIQDHQLKTVIGLPAALFASTQIPTIVLEMQPSGSADEVYVVNAEKEFLKGKKQNTLLPEHIAKILGAYNLRANVEKFSHIASYDEIKENDYNLNIPRYVDTSEPAPEIDAAKELEELVQIKKEEKECVMQLKEMFGQLVAEGKKLEELKKIQSLWDEYAKTFA
jgi:type I restriction enzyme M protein